MGVTALGEAREGSLDEKPGAVSRVERFDRVENSRRYRLVDTETDDPVPDCQCRIRSHAGAYSATNLQDADPRCSSDSLRERALQVTMCVALSSLGACGACHTGASIRSSAPHHRVEKTDPRDEDANTSAAAARPQPRQTNQTIGCAIE